MPHLLVMTATPIPRTLALSLYGDLDLSAIDEMPPGRQSPKTVLLGSDERHLAYERVRRAAAEGEQAFIICPLVEESEVLQARSATEEYESLRTGELQSLGWGCCTAACDRPKRMPSCARFATASSTCWSRPRSSRWASTCRTPRSC